MRSSRWSLSAVSLACRYGLPVLAAEEIVVNARRREESLQDTPIAISPFFNTRPS